MKRILVFAAHPDDDIIWCGGSLARHVKLGSACAISRTSRGSLAYPDVLSYEVWTPLSDFENVEDISEFIDKKSRCLEEHESQMNNVRYEAFEGLARYRGAMTGKGNEG